MSDLCIELLVDHPNVIPTLASWEQREWGYLLPGVSFEQLVSAFRGRANRDRIPMTLLGFVGGELVATASLVVVGDQLGVRIKDILPSPSQTQSDSDQEPAG